MDRLKFLKTMGIGVVMLAAGLPGFAETLASAGSAKGSDFY
jgi:hypothetical protein